MFEMIGKLGLLLCLWLALGGFGQVPAWANSQFQILDQPILTLRTPVGATETRLQVLEQRFQQILAEARPPLMVTVQGDANQAQILINDRSLLEVTAADAAANATTQVNALADLWADRLRSAIGPPQAQQRLLRATGLPEQIRFRGQIYRRQPDPVPDLGRFYTDGSRVEERVLFWEVDPRQGSRSLTTAPVALYLLNAYRQFVVYRPF